HLDGDLELVPLGVGQREVGVEQVALGDGGELATAGAPFGEEEVAGPAGAHEGPALQVDDVGVLVGDGFVAQLAAFPRSDRSGLLEEPLEPRGQRLVGPGGADEAAEAPGEARVPASGHATPPAAGLRPISTGTRP